MDPNLHHTPLHWGYTSTPTQNHWTPPQTRAMKRALSESDCDDLYSEESSKEHTSPGGTDGCHLLTRKKRRGVIEKKRRDRINSSLSELKRLVPSAYEKQGSAKLEKAEILQLTVEHLKSIHAKGLDSMTYDPQRFAMDYHIIGFRECASEVARYLVTIEGMDIQDPLRLRLMSHLQYFVQQREISAKACSSPNWSSSSYQPNCTPPAYQAYPTQTAASSNSYIPNLPPPIQPIQPTYPSSSLNNPMHPHGIPHCSRTSVTTSVTETSSLMSVPGHPQSHLQPHSQQQQQQQVGGGNSANTASQQLSPTHHDPQQRQQQSQQQSTQHYSSEHDHHHHHHDHQATTTYIDLTGPADHHRDTTANIAAGYGQNSQYPTSAAGTQGYNPSADNVNYNGNGTKPYRPWGAEMAY